MKRVLFGLLAVSASAAVASVTQTVASVSMTAIDSGLANTVVAISALDLGGGDITISNLVKTTNLTAGDKLYAFNGSNYDCWELSSGGFWQKMLKTFRISSTGEVAETGVDASLVTMATGKGIWLSRQDYSKPFYIYGAWTDATQSSVSAGAASLIGNPTLAAATPTPGAGAVAGDWIHVPTAGMTKKYRWDGSKWQTPSGFAYKDENPSIPAGTGFWYVPKNGQAVTVNW